MVHISAPGWRPRFSSQVLDKKVLKCLLFLYNVNNFADMVTKDEVLDRYKTSCFKLF